jgi:hypothetical protein
MSNPLVLAVLLLSGGLAACATPAENEQAAAKPEKIYRTGSNIPVRDTSVSRVENVKVDQTAPTAPMPRPGPGR